MLFVLVKRLLMLGGLKLMDDGLYKFSNGKYIDLDRIVTVDDIIFFPPEDMLELYREDYPEKDWDYSSGTIIITCQLLEKPVKVVWDNDRDKYNKESNPIKEHVEEQYKLLLSAWKARKQYLLKHHDKQSI